MANDWIYVPLVELTSTPPTYGVVQPGKHTPDGVPMVRVNNFQGHALNLAEVMRIAPSIETKYTRTRIQTGDVLITIVGSVGQVAIVSDELSGWNIARAVAMIRPNDPNLSRWISLVLRSPDAQYQLGTTANTTVQTTINLKDLRLLRIPLPEEPERSAIAHILGTLDDKIELNRKQNETLEAMARALFKAWFVDFEPVRAKLEGRWQRGQSLPGLPAHLYDLFPDRLVESELGEIPQGWEISVLGDFVETVKGRSYKSEELAESTTALVTLKSFARGGGYRTDGLKSFTGKYKQEQVIEPGEVVIACTDVTQAAELIGRAAIVRRVCEYQRLVASLDTMIVRPQSERVTRAFLYYLGRSESFVAHTYSHTTGTTVLHLGKEAIPSYRFVLPPREIVRHFDVAASNGVALAHAIEDESERLVALRDTLLPKLISGELRVKAVAAFLKERGL